MIKKVKIVVKAIIAVIIPKTILIIGRQLINYEINQKVIVFGVTKQKEQIIERYTRMKVIKVIEITEKIRRKF